MSYILVWLDQENFKFFIKGKEFTAWSNESTDQYIQISVPKAAICTYEYIEDHNGTKFKCYSESLW